MIRRARERKSDPLGDTTPEQIIGEYHQTKNEYLRNRLMERFMPLVRQIAEQIHARLPATVDVDDLQQAGVFGLFDAIEAFRGDKKVKFQTYCSIRIRGAILDELRRMDWVPRLVRSRASKIDRARQQLQMDAGVEPTETEMAKALGVDEAEYQHMARDAKPIGVVSLERQRGNRPTNRDLREVDVVPDPKEHNPVSEAERHDLLEQVNERLCRTSRQILDLYYFQQKTMKEVGQALNLCESRISQLHSGVLIELRRAYRSAN